MRPRLASAHSMICLRSPILRAHWVQHWYTAISFGLETRWYAHSRSRPRKEPHSAGFWGWKVSGQAAISPAPALVELSSRSEEHTSELQSRPHLVCRLLLEKKKRRLR